MDYWNNDRIGLAQNMRPMLSLNRVAQPIKFIVSGLYYNNNNRAAQVLIDGRWYSLHPAPPPPSFINSSRYLSPPPLSNSVRAFPSNNKDSSCMQRMNSISGEGLIDINLSADHSLVASCAIGKNGQSKVVDSSPLIKSFRRSSPCLDNYSTIQDLSGTIAPMPLLRRYNGELWNDIQPPPLCWRIHLENYITTKNLKGREAERIKMIIKNPLSATQELLDQLVLNNFPCVSRCIHYLSTEVLLFKHQLKCAKAFFVRDWLSSDQEARKHYQHVYCSYFCAPSCEHRRAIRHRVHSKSCDSDSDSESDVDGAVGVTVCGDSSATVNDVSESDYHSDNSAEDISDYLSDDDGENNELLNGEEGEELEEDIDSKEEEIDDQQCDDDHNDEEIEEEQEECDGEECENINDGECEEQFSEEELENNIDEFPDHD